MQEALKLNITTNNEFSNKIIGLIEKSKKDIVQVINSQMVMTYWNIGKEIFLEEQKGQERAEYGKEVIDTLSTVLTEKYGKGFAVIVSAVLFGVMHGNPLQIVFGTLVGLILGYIAIEYSIKWSIILHIANNFILGDVIGGLFGLLPDDVEGIAFTVFLGIGFVIGFVLLIIRRKEWISWLKENAAPGSYYLNALTTPSAVIFIGYNLLNGLMLLTLIFMEPFL